MRMGKTQNALQLERARNVKACKTKGKAANNVVGGDLRFAADLC